MMQVTRSPSPAYLGSQFDRFLFATIGEDEHGGLLSVVSTLARLDIDPWVEAAKLSVMSEAAATERMSMLLRSSPAAEGAAQASQTTVQQLIRLLPGRGAATNGAAPAVKWTGFGRRAHVWAIVLYVLLMASIFGEQMVTRGREPASAGGGAYAIGAGLASPPGPTAIKSR